MNLYNDLERKIETVRTALADHLYKTENENLEKVEILNVKKRAFSTIIQLRVRTSRVTKRFVMKTVTHHPTNKDITERENQAVVEYNILKHLYPKFQEIENCSVPQPILVVPEIEAYVMEFIEGHILLDDHRYSRYLSSQDGFDKLRKAYFYSGKWLRHFQEFTGIRTADFDSLVEVIKKCDHRLKLIEESSDPRCPKGLRSMVMDSLHKELAKLSGEKILISGRHGDFSPINIMTGTDGITVIDFLGYKEEPFPIDLLKILVFLEDERMSLTCSKRRVESLGKSFLEGYGEIPHIPVPVLVICEAMQRIVSLWGNISNPKNHFHHSLEANLRIKKHVNWLINEKDRKLLWQY